MQTNKQIQTEVKRIQDMHDVKEMTLDALIREATERAVKGNSEIIFAVHDALRKGGNRNNPEFDKAQRAKTENEMRLHALRAELIARGVDWIDAYNWPKQESGGHA